MHCRLHEAFILNDTPTEADTFFSVLLSLLEAFEGAIEVLREQASGGSCVVFHVVFVGVQVFIGFGNSTKISDGVRLSDRITGIEGVLGLGK